MKSKTWFIKNIGQRIYRDKTSCNCRNCEDVYKNGLVIRDKNHAEYLYTIQCDFKAEGVKLNYRDER